MKRKYLCLSDEYIVGSSKLRADHRQLIDKRISSPSYILPPSALRTSDVPKIPRLHGLTCQEITLGVPRALAMIIGDVTAQAEYPLKAERI
jgi:hypothetical protein